MCLLSRRKTGKRANLWIPPAVIMLWTLRRQGVPEHLANRPEPIPSGLRRSTILLLVVLLSVLVFVGKGYRDERTVLHFRDFKQPYASARCLLHGCNPYSEPDTLAEFLRAGGDNSDAVVFQPYSALYPPFSFALLTPLAALNYHAAHLVWFWTIAGLFSLAAMLMADLCIRLGSSVLAPVLLAAFTITSTILLMEGQISGVVIALTAIGFWCLLRQKLTWVAVLAFTIALVLKPHDSALLVGYLLFAGPGWRKTFFAIAVLTLVLVVAGTLWCAHQPASAHWFTDLQANLKGNAGAGNVNDPAGGNVQAVNMANLQPLFAAENRSPRFYNTSAEVVTLLLLGCWMLPAWRMRNSMQKHILAIAAMACIMLLPIYHRQYDTRVLLLVFPAVALLLAWRRSWGVAGLVLLGVATVTTSHTYLGKLTIDHDRRIEAAGALKTLLLYRPIPEIELLLAIFLVAAFLACYRADAALPGGASVPDRL